MCKPLKARSGAFGTSQAGKAPEKGRGSVGGVNRSWAGPGMFKPPNLYRVWGGACSY